MFVKPNLVVVGIFKLSTTNPTFLCISSGWSDVAMLHKSLDVYIGYRSPESVLVWPFFRFSCCLHKRMTLFREKNKALLQIVMKGGTDQNNERWTAHMITWLSYHSVLFNMVVFVIVAVVAFNLLKCFEQIDRTGDITIRIDSFYIIIALSFIFVAVIRGIWIVQYHNNWKMNKK